MFQRLTDSIGGYGVQDVYKITPSPDTIVALANTEVTFTVTKNGRPHTNSEIDVVFTGTVKGDNSRKVTDDNGQFKMTLTTTIGSAGSTQVEFKDVQSGTRLITAIKFTVA